MKRGRSTGTLTKAQAARFDAIKEIGCVACWMRGYPGTPAEIHHLTVGGKHGQKRRGHDFTVGLCMWHHRGGSELTRHAVAIGMTPVEQKLKGPSYALQPRLFRETFGNDEELLRYQAELLGETDAA